MWLDSVKARSGRASGVGFDSHLSHPEQYVYGARHRPFGTWGPGSTPGCSVYGRYSRLAPLRESLHMSHGRQGGVLRRRRVAAATT